MADELYNGSLTNAFIEDIKNGGGIITEQDMANYRLLLYFYLLAFI